MYAKGISFMTKGIVVMTCPHVFVLQQPVSRAKHTWFVTETC